MTRDRALALAVGSFILCVGFVVVIFAMLDIRPLFAIGPVLAVAVSAAMAYWLARDGRL